MVRRRLEERRRSRRRAATTGTGESSVRGGLLFPRALLRFWVMGLDHPNIGRTSQNLSNHLIFFGRRPLIDKLLEQHFYPILPKKEVGGSLTHI
jgi:hypothetical protein